MYHRVTVRILAVAACGWFLAGQAEALSLGRARAVALIGRPLEVAVPVTLDRAGNDTPCPGATLYYGDSEVQAPAVRWEPSGPGQGHVRITSTVPVDEPTVTVYVRVGCGDTSTRRYVLLAELPPENEPAVRPPLIATPAVPAAPSAPAPSATSPRRAQAGAPAAGPRGEARSQPRAAAAPAPAPAPASRARRPAPPAPQARLRLEPLDLSVDRDPTLRLSAELGVPAATDQQRRNELVALWIALQRSPEQSIEELARLQGVERELQSVRESSRQNAAALNDLRTQVAQAQGERRTASYLVVGLAVLLAALVAWIAWRWQRARELERVGRWFEAQGDSVQSPEPAPVQPTVDSAGKRSSAPASVPVPAAAAAQPATSAPRAAPAPAAAQRRGPASAWGGNSEFHASRGGAMRMVGVEELIDVHDKADFFLSIGETDQALALLEAHVHDQVETGALAWMDLLELYHSRGKRAEFERLRAEFGQRFAAQVPDFEHFDQPTASLESYSRALSRIVALWPSRRVLDVIEESIFRNPGAGGAEPFSLEAYRELVLLYHVARDVSPEGQAAPTTRSGFPDTSLQPLNAPERAEARAPESRAPQEPLGEQERLMIPPKSARLGVDIDLEGLATPETEPPEELPALDFDISTFDPGHHDPDTKK